jgi:hypothetical protein
MFRLLPDEAGANSCWSHRQPPDRRSRGLKYINKNWATDWLWKPSQSSSFTCTMFLVVAEKRRFEALLGGRCTLRLPFSAEAQATVNKNIVGDWVYHIFPNLEGALLYKEKRGIF